MKKNGKLQGFKIKWSRNRKKEKLFETSYAVPVRTLTSLAPSQWPPA